MNTTCESRTLCLICVLYSTIWSRDHSEELTDARYEVPFSMKTVLLVSQLSQSQLCLCLSHSSSCACRQADFRAGRSAQVELHRDDGGPSEERDEEGGVVTLGAGAGRCPGPAAAEVEPRLLRTNGACERAVCLRYGQLVADLVDGRLVALLTTRYGASRSHIRQATRYLGCELVHLCALTWVIPSRRAA